MRRTINECDVCKEEIKDSLTLRRVTFNIAKFGQEKSDAVLEDVCLGCQFKLTEGFNALVKSLSEEHGR